MIYESDDIHESYDSRFERNKYMSGGYSISLPANSGFGTQLGELWHDVLSIGGPPDTVMWSTLSDQYIIPCHVETQYLTYFGTLTIVEDTHHGGVVAFSSLDQRLE